MFTHWKRTATLLRDAQALCARQQHAIDQLEKENLQLIGQAFQLSASKKPEVTTMTQEDELRAIALADAAGRAANHGLQALSEKLNKQALRLIEGTNPVKPEDVPAGTGNQELYDMRLLCADQAHELRVKDTEILSLKSKVGWLETQVDRLRPAPIRPVDAVSVTVKAEG